MGCTECIDHLRENSGGYSATGIQSADCALKLALFGTILVRHYAAGTISPNSFWKRINDLSVVRMGVLSLNVVPDLIYLGKGELITRDPKEWKGSTVGIFYLLCDSTTTLLFAADLKWVKLGPFYNLIDKVCLTTWVGAACFDLGVHGDRYQADAVDNTKAQVDKTRLPLLTHKFGVFAFAISSSIWSGYSLPTTLAGFFSAGCTLYKLWDQAQFARNPHPR